MLSEHGTGMTGSHATICRFARACVPVTFRLAARSCMHANHSFACEFDANRPARVTGTVVEIKSISSPARDHVRCDQEGKVVWRLEAGTAPHLA